MGPQRDDQPRATGLPGEIRRRFGGSENLHEEGLEFLYARLRVVNVPNRNAALLQLQTKAREQYLAYAARRDAESLKSFSAKAKGKGAVPVPPVGTPGPIAPPAFMPVQEPGESFSEYMSRISTMPSPGFDADVAKPRPVLGRIDRPWGTRAAETLKPRPGTISTHRAGSAVYDPIFAGDAEDREARTKAAAAARELSAAFENERPLAALVDHFKREDNLKALMLLVENIAAAARDLTPRQRRKLERMSPELAEEIRRAERAAEVGLEAGIRGNQ